MAPPLAGPLLADYYITCKCRYDITQINSQPEIQLRRSDQCAGRDGFPVWCGMALNNILSDWLTGLLALVITVIIYLILHPLLAVKSHPPACQGDHNEKKVYLNEFTTEEPGKPVR